MTELRSGTSARVPSLRREGRDRVRIRVYSVSTIFVENRWFSAVSVQK